MNKKIKAIIFDIHGVVIGGDLVLERPYEMPGTKNLIEKLRKNYCVVALSNVGPDMWPIWDSRHRITDLFEKVYWSGQLGVKKPDPKAFNHVLDDLGVKSTDVVFFDNREENVAGARSLGIVAFIFNGAKDAEAKLKGLGINF